MAKASSNKVSAELQPVPSSWPGGFGIYQYSKQAVLYNLGTNVALLALVFLVASLTDLIFHGTAMQGFGSLLNLVLSGLLSGAAALTVLAGVRRQKLSFEKAITTATQYWVRLIVATFLVGLALFGSALLLLIPLFFVAPRLTLVIYFLVDKDLGPIEAIKASWNATKGHSGKAWGVIGVTFLILLLMITIIGIPFALYFYVMYSAAFALLYEKLKTAPTKLAETAKK